jgi:hypothetical protein
MFILNGSRLAQGTAFTVNDIQYPANWLNLTTLVEKQAIGITEVADEVRADDRFYWDGDITNPKALEDKEEVDQDGNPLFVKVYDATADNGKGAMVDSTERLVTKGLKSNFISQVKHTAGTLLAQTDWMVIRKAERDVAIPANVVTYRASVVSKATELEATITAVTTVAQLSALDLSFPSKS